MNTANGSLSGVLVLYVSLRVTSRSPFYTYLFRSISTEPHGAFLDITWAGLIMELGEGGSFREPCARGEN